MDCFVGYVCDALELVEQKPGAALALACILIDASAKKHYNLKHGKVESNRKVYKEFIKDHQSIILGAGKVKIIAPGDIILNGISFQEIVYKDVRCALLHEAEQKIVISDGIVGMHGGKVHFDDIVRGLIHSCVLANCNNDIVSTTSLVLNLNNSSILLDEAWGREDLFWSTLPK